MRILIVNGSAKVSGGAEKIAITSAAKLAERGHSVKLIAARGPLSDREARSTDFEIEFLSDSPLTEGRNLVERAKMTWPSEIGSALTRELRKENGRAETLIHFHSGYLELGIPGFRALAATSIPLVYTHHDYTWACPLMGFYDYTAQSTCELVGGSFQCFTRDCTNRYLDKLVRYGRHFGTHQISGIGGRVAHHVFVSRTSQEKLSPYIPGNSSGSVIYNASDQTKAPRNPSGQDSELVFLGRLTTEKDPLTFARAATEAQMSFSIIGDGPVRSHLEAEGFGKSLLGWMDAGQVRARLEGSKALVVTSRCKETASLVVQEAAAVGVPSVVPGDTAAAEFVDHGCTGLVYDRTDPNSLSSCLGRLKDVSRANFLGSEAYRRYWESPPTWEKHVDELEKVYAGVLS